MATNASPKQAITAVLGTVTNIAQSVSSIFDTASGGVAMMNRYVQTAAEKQILATDYEMADFEDQLLSTVSVERTRQNREISRFLDEDPANKAEFEAVYTNLQAAVAARRAERSKARS